jgi:hypothetical protein
MKIVTAIIAISLVSSASSDVFAQLGNTQTKDVPAFPIPDLQAYVPEIAKAVELIGQNRVEDSFNSLKTELNPAFRNEGAHTKFRDSWMKLFLQIGRLRLEFDSYDIVGYYRVSSQAYFLYGIANGANGPVMFDFRVFRYRGRWHVHSFSFNMSGWDRKPVMHEDAVKLAVPVSYPLGVRPIAKTDRPNHKRQLRPESPIIGRLTEPAQSLAN